MHMKHVCPVGEHGVDVDVLDIGDVGDGIFWHEKVGDMLDVAIVLIDGVVLPLDLVKGIKTVWREERILRTVINMGDFEDCLDFLRNMSHAMRLK